MTDGSGLEMTLAQLATKIESQARFTRSVLVICTVAILGIMFYTMTEMFSSLPSAFIMHYMANLKKIICEWEAIDQHIARKAATWHPAK
jgi:hypothetical protein